MAGFDGSLSPPPKPASGRAHKGWGERAASKPLRLSGLPEASLRPLAGRRFPADTSGMNQASAFARSEATGTPRALA